MAVGIAFTAESAVKARERIDAQREKYKADYLDEPYWRELSKKIGARLPPSYTRPSDADIKHWLRICKVPYPQFVEAFGWATAEEFETLNPNHGMKIVAGLILELMEENERIKKLAEERVYESGAKLGTSAAPQQRAYRGKSKAKQRADDKVD